MSKGRKIGKAWVEILLALSLSRGGSYVPLSRVWQQIKRKDSRKEPFVRAKESFDSYFPV